MTETIDAAAFEAQVSDLVSALMGLAECARVVDHEWEVRQVVADEVVDRWVREDRLPGPTPGQTVRATGAPREWLTAVRDLLGVLFEPAPAPCFLLNDNPGFIRDAIPDTGFHWFCVSRTAGPADTVERLWHEQVAPELCRQLGDGVRLAGLLVAGVGPETPEFVPGADFSLRLSDVTGSTMGLGDAIEVTAAAAEDRASQAGAARHAGVTIDPSLGADVFRISVWAFGVPVGDRAGDTGETVSP